MKNRYSILSGTVIVLGLFILLNTVFWDNPTVLTDSFVLVLIMGGFVATFTSPGTKARAGLISGLGVSIILIPYTLINSTFVPVTAGTLLNLLVLPGFMMCIGGYIAKLVKMEIKG
ncbi:hypothetical protein [Methanobacterium congolense]|uniref:TIGR04086 family membrane protein n=1 Tax=Methanobacterium congolense TaxID=118062 RepID=A0A1D3L2X2_9EURY|nr:hypothetical protein [Methanobacterium congolense]SCG85961.1 putative protein [Methanobacterium congolense]